MQEIKNNIPWILLVFSIVYIRFLKKDNSDTKKELKKSQEKEVKVLQHQIDSLYKEVQDKTVIEAKTKEVQKDKEE